MNSEIKEHMQNCIDREESCLLNSDNTKLLLDYITNLQQKVEQYENPEDLTLFYMWIDEKAKDKMKELQKENERLKDELETMTFTAKVKQEAIDALIKRIDKAIKLIESYNLGKYDYTIPPGGIIEVLDILNGDNND